MSISDCSQCPATGSEPCSPSPGSSHCSSPWSGSVGNRRCAQPRDDYTGSLSPDSRSPSEDQQSSASLEMDTGSPLDPRQLMSTSGKTIPGLLEPSSNSVPNHFDEMTQEIGKQLNSLPRPVNWSLSQQTYTFGKLLVTVVIIAHSYALLATMSKFLQLSGTYMSFGAYPELVKVSEHGKRQVFRLTLKIHAPSGGAVTKVKQMVKYN